MTTLATAGSDDALLKQDGAAARLGLAAAPTFGMMAGISAFAAQGMTMCSAASPLAPLNEMVVMYLLMSLFHLPPWLKRLSRRRRAAPHHFMTQTEGH